MKAVGLYLRVLREEKRIGRVALGKRLGTDDTQIERIEKGQIDTRSSLLFGFVDVVQGDPDDVATLILDVEDVPEKGQALAERVIARLKRASRAEQEEYKRRANALIEALTADPRKLDLLIGYGERLLEERPDDPKSQ